MKFHIAPIQGHTDAAFRAFHAANYNNGDVVYYSPFIRLEHDDIRDRDRRDIKSKLNDNIKLIPQIIFRDRKELESLVKIIRNEGFNNIDLNMGCPFPLQTGHGRGAATILNEELGDALLNVIEKNNDIRFSVKMRLGLESPDEWRDLINRLNRVEVDHIAVHPRVARQQYKGELYMSSFEEILNLSKNPIVFNGEIKTPEDIDILINKYPAISGIMIGRGILNRPSLIEEYSSGSLYEPKERLRRMLDFHDEIYHHYSEILCGESQLLSKIKPFWEYAEDEVGRKIWKTIKKSTNLAKYNTAIALITQQL